MLKSKLNKRWNLYWTLPTSVLPSVILIRMLLFNQFSSFCLSGRDPEVPELVKFCKYLSIYKSF